MTNEQAIAIKEVLKDHSSDSASAIKAWNKIDLILTGTPTEIVLDRKIEDQPTVVRSVPANPTIRTENIPLRKEEVPAVLTKDARDPFVKKEEQLRNNPTLKK